VRRHLCRLREVNGESALTVSTMQYAQYWVPMCTSYVLTSWMSATNMSETALSSRRLGLAVDWLAREMLRAGTQHSL
jgi:hypothetical protein